MDLQTISEIERLHPYLTPQEQERLHALLRTPTATELMHQLGMTPDPWQAKALESECARLLLLCSRQAGKSTTTAVKALWTALYVPGSLVLIISPSHRQSGELFRKVNEFYARLGKPVNATEETKSWLTLENRSRIVALPDSEQTIRGFSGVKLLIVDEAARVPDDLYKAVRPMLAASQGTLWALSTPFGKRGWFYSEWVSDAKWERIKARAIEIPRFTQEFLDEERRQGAMYFAQEFDCSFEGGVGILLPIDLIQTCEVSDPRWGRTPRILGGLYIGIDLGRSVSAKAGRSVVWTWEQLGGLLYCREIHVMHGVGFDDQYDQIEERITRPGVRKANVDKGSIGAHIAERLERTFGSKVEGVQLTQQTQGKLALQFKTGFEEKKVQIPCDPVLRDDLQLVSQAVDQNGIAVIKTDTDATGHADRFWAAALGYDAAFRTPKPVIVRGASGNVARIA